jgi:opacity protein-like surface antigen
MSSATTLAADLAAKAPAYRSVATPYDWTGIYLGGHIGWASADRNFQPTSGFFGEFINPGARQQSDRFVGGGQVGFNQQFGRWVFGIEADASTGGHSGSSTVVSGLAGFVQTYDASVDWTATLTGRVGYAWDRWMVYGKGGAALMQETYGLVAPDLITPASPYANAHAVRVGWTLGAGVEHAFHGNWSWKAEYNFMRFDGDEAIGINMTGITAIAAISRTDVDIHAVKLGLNYRFAASTPGYAAQQLIAKAPPMAAGYNWNGAYIGGHVGWAAASRSFDTTLGAFGAVFNPGFAQDPNGVIGGAQIGFNRQSGSWVWGLEADLSGAHITETTTVVSTALALSQTFDVAVDWTAMLTGRFGYAWGPWMAYLKGGAAAAQENYALTLSTGSREDTRVTRLGWTLGGGVERAIAGNWSWKAEYNFLRFENDDSIVNAFPAGNAFGTPSRTDLDIHAVKLGVNYRFGGYTGAPVAAKY